MAKEEVTQALKNKIECAQNYLSTYYITPKWGYYDNLYFCRREKSAEAEQWRMNVFIPIIWQTIADILPRFIEGIFGSGDFFGILPKDKDDEKSVKQAMGQEELIKSEIEKGGFYNAAYNASVYALRRGIGWIKIPWEYEKGTKEYFDIKKGELVEVGKNIVIKDNPCFYSPDPACISFNPNAECFDDIEYMIETEEITRETLEGYMDKKDLYDVKVIKEIIDTKADADNNEPKRRYKKDTVYERSYMSIMIDNTYVIRRHKSPYKNLRGIPFFPVTYWTEPNKIISRGICEILADLQDYINDLVNLKGDNIILSVNQMFVMKEDTNLKDEDLKLKPGHIISLSSPDDIKPLQLGGVKNDVFNEVEQMSGFVSRTIGTAPSLTQPEGGQATNNKTATAARILASSMVTRFSTIIDANVANCVKPMLKWIIDLNQQYMTEDRAMELIGETKAKQLQIEVSKEDLDVDYDYIITGQDGLATKEEEVNMTLGLVELFSVIPGAMERLNSNVLVDRLVKRLDIPKEVLISEEEQGLDPASMPPEAQADMKALASSLGVSEADIVAQLESGVPIDQLIATAKANEEQMAMQSGLPPVI